MGEPRISTLRIMCMSWNTQSVRLSESLGSGHRAGSWFDMSFKRYDPDFLPALVQHIVRSECHLFVCALQESAKPGSHFISDALPAALDEIGFKLLHRNRLMGVGATTFQQLCREGDLMARGLRLAVYARREWAADQTIRVDENWWHATNFDVLSRGKGALAICLYVRGLGRLCLMNCHLPFNARSVALKNSERVITSMSEQVKSLRSLISRCRAAHAPHYLILMGDLNFRVLNFSDGGVDPTNIWSALVASLDSRKGVYERRDELRLAIGYRSLPPLMEGVDNSGPYRFMPTGKMRHGRQSGCVERRAYFFGHGAAQNPSWCDRILYARNEHLSGDCEPSLESDNNNVTEDRIHAERALPEGFGSIECTMYDRFEAGQTMTRSDHSAVIGCYEIKYNCCADSDSAGVDIAAFVAHDCGQRANDENSANNDDDVVIEFIDSGRRAKDPPMEKSVSSERLPAQVDLIDNKREEVTDCDTIEPYVVESVEPDVEENLEPIEAHGDGEANLIDSDSSPSTTPPPPSPPPLDTDSSDSDTFSE